MSLDPDRRPKDATEWESRARRPCGEEDARSRPPRSDGDRRTTRRSNWKRSATEIAGECGRVANARPSPPAGGWYSRPTGTPGADWQLVAATPAEVRRHPGRGVPVLDPLRRDPRRSWTRSAPSPASRASAYLNLSYCDGRDRRGAGPPAFVPRPAATVPARRAEGITDAGLLHLRGLAGPARARTDRLPAAHRQRDQVTSGRTAARAKLCGDVQPLTPLSTPPLANSASTRFVTAGSSSSGGGMCGFSRASITTGPRQPQCLRCVNAPTP